MNWLNEVLNNDPNPVETQEWIESLKAVIDVEGSERAHQLLEGMVELTRRSGAYLPFSPTTEYVNTIEPQLEAKSPGNAELEWRIRSIIRWNAMATVVRANRKPGDLGGHIASFASGATLYDVGFNHFWRAPSENHPGDLLFIQGHSAPGIYARSFLEGRISEEQLDKFRMEVDGGGLSSYPHPWLMPEYWQTPTVSMGLGPLAAIYQAQFMRYLENRGLIEKSDRKVWCFIGDGESDEPETLGAIALAGREGLDNLIFVVNCNLQRLDGPVRGNGKIIQELEGVFRGGGWNVIKLLWGRLLGCPAGQGQRRRAEEADDGNRRRRIPELQGLRRRVYPRAFLRQVPGNRCDGRRPQRRRHLAPEPWWPRPAQGVRRLPPGREHQGHADRHPGQDREGLRHGQRR